METQYHGLIVLTNLCSGMIRYLIVRCYLALAHYLVARSRVTVLEEHDGGISGCLLDHGRYRYSGLKVEGDRSFPNLTEI